MSVVPGADCVRVLHDLFAWLDGELGEARAREVRLHLDGCGACSSRFAFEARLKSHLRKVTTTEVPPEVELRIRAVLAHLPDR